MMWETKATIIKAGMLTQILDAGRIGGQDLGVPVSGCLDRHSAQIANTLVGNAINNPVLEITLQGPQIKFEGDAYVALTGGDLSATLNGKSVKLYETIHVPSNAVLSFGKPLSGIRTYLAIAGKWRLNKWLDSVNLIPSIDIAELQENKIAKGYALHISEVNMVSKKKWEGERFSNKEVHTIRIIEGPEFYSFKDSDRNYFLNEVFSISNNSNRMAYSLIENIPDYTPPTDMISSGVVPGTIQISNAGQALLLMNESGTTGGYPRIANVISTDLSQLAQLKYRDKIKFSKIEIEEAQDIFNSQASALNSLS